MTLLATLRTSTRTLHARLDAVDDFTSSRTAYVRFLHASLDAVRRFEDAARPALAEGCSRVAALRADLAELGAAVDADAPPAPSAQGDAAAFGYAYVLEGSSLGGVVLAERADAAGLEVPTRYLRLYGRETGTTWRGFLERLEGWAAGANAGERGAACAAAVEAFQAYVSSFETAGLLR